MSLMRLVPKKYELTYHYVGDSTKTFKIVQICHSFIDAVNLTLSDVRWHPIVFDTWIEEDLKEGNNQWE